MATNPAASLPRRRARARGARGVPVRRRLRLHAPTDTDRARRRAAARRRLGREGRHRHQLGAPHLAPARRSCAPPGEARPDWWIVAEVARRLGFGEAFAWHDAADDLPRARRAVRLRERRHGACSIFRPLPTSTTRHTTHCGRCAGRCRPAGRARAAGCSRTAASPRRRRARRGRYRPPGAGLPIAAGLPLLLNTGRVRDQWHTMTRTGLVPR